MFLSVRFLKSAVCGLVLLMSVWPVFSAEIDVPGSYATIQEGINAAAPGDTVIVADGIYTENIVVDKPLTVRSENGASNTFVQAANSGYSGFYVRADQVVIEGFTITGVSTAGSAGILVSSGYRQCTIRDNAVGSVGSPNAYGVYLSDCHDNLVEGNSFIGNAEYGIVILRSTGNTVQKNSFSLNGVHGIYCWEASGNQFIANTLSRNVSYGIVLTHSCNDNLISQNKLDQNHSGIRLTMSCNNNRVADNLCENGFSYAIILDHGSDNNKVYGNECRNHSHGPGIQLWETGPNELYENVLSENTYGILAQTATDCRMYENSCADNTETGIAVGFNSQRNQVYSNQCTGNSEDGIAVYDSPFNAVYLNTCDNNGRAGLGFLSSNASVFFRNSISGNTNGVWAINSLENRVFLNSFIGNTSEVYSSNSETIWHSEQEVDYYFQGVFFTGILGNFYSSHDLTDTNGDGVTDLPKDHPGIEPDDEYPLAMDHGFYMTPSGDMDFDDDVDGWDAGAFSVLFAAGNRLADLNGDLAVDGLDIEMFASGFGK